MFYRYVLPLLFCISVANCLSVSWNTTLQPICGPNVERRITLSMLECDKLMDPELNSIYEDCVRKVNAIPAGKQLDKPKLCYYSENGSLLDRCKMTQYKARGVTMSELIDKQQEHTVSCLFHYMIIFLQISILHTVVFEEDCRATRLGESMFQKQ